jgi:putative membrane protein
MKAIKTINVLVLAGVASMSACQPGKRDATVKESVEVAKEANDSTFTDRKDEKDADFIVNAVAANYGEIKMAQLAHNKSVDDHVKEMAAKLVQDHTKVLNELKGYADMKGIAIPLEETSEDAEELAGLDKQSVDKFDKEWCKAMEIRHKKSISKFETRMDRTEDPELRTWISNTLPALKNHLSMLEKDVPK